LLLFSPGLVLGGIHINSQGIDVYYKSGQPIYIKPKNSSKDPIERIDLSTQKDQPSKVLAGKVDLKKSSDEVAISCSFETPSSFNGPQLIDINKYCRSIIDVKAGVPKVLENPRKLDVNIPYLISPRRTRISVGRDLKIQWKKVDNASRYEITLWKINMYGIKEVLDKKMYEANSSEFKTNQLYEFETLCLFRRDLSSIDNLPNGKYLIEIKAIFSDGKTISSESEKLTEVEPTNGISGVRFIVEALNEDEKTPNELASLFHNSSAIDDYEKSTRLNESYFPHAKLSSLYSAIGLDWLAEKAHVRSIELAKDSITKETLCQERNVGHLCTS
jgi:hypothetical protein